MPIPPPIPLARLRAALASVGAAPRRRHGQHFLRDAHVLEAIVEAAGVGPDDVVLEVGPGPGLLTRHLLARGARVVGIEIDPAMERVADALVEPALRARLEWIAADVLAGGGRLAPAVGERLGDCTAFVSNLPYNVSGPLLGALAAHPDAPERWAVLVQLEMAQRLLAAPGSKDFGSLSAVVQRAADWTAGRRVAPGSFWPEPRVWSRSVSARLRADRPGPAAFERFEAFAALAFQARRKTLINSVARAARVDPEAVRSRLELQDFQERWRAEAFGTLALWALADRWAATALGGPRPTDAED